MPRSPIPFYCCFFKLNYMLCLKMAHSRHYGWPGRLQADRSYRRTCAVLSILSTNTVSRSIAGGGIFIMKTHNNNPPQLLVRHSSFLSKRWVVERKVH